MLIAYTLGEFRITLLFQSARSFLIIIAFLTDKKRFGSREESEVEGFLVFLHIRMMGYLCLVKLVKG